MAHTYTHTHAQTIYTHTHTHTHKPVYIYTHTNNTVLNQKQYIIKGMTRGTGLHLVKNIV